MQIILCNSTIYIRRHLNAVISVSTRGQRRAVIGSDLVSRCEFGPGFVGAPVVVLSMSALHILMKAQDLSGLQLSHCRPLGQLHTETQQQHLLSLSARLLAPQSKYICKKSCNFISCSFLFTFFCPLFSDS